MEQAAATSPRPGSRLLPALAALSSLFVFALSANALPAALLRAAGELGITPEALAGVASAQFVAFVLTTIAAGLTADVIGKKPVFVAASALIAAGAAVCSSARSLGAAYAGGVLMGMGGGIMESMSCALLSDLFPERRKLFLNLSQVIYCAGAIGGPVLMGLLLPLGVSWRVFFAGIGVLSAALLGLYAVSSIPAPAEPEQINPARLAGLLRRSSFLVPCGVLFLYVLPESCVVVYANLYLQKYRGAPENWAIYSIAAVWATMAAGRALCALLPERHSYEKVIVWLLGASAVALAAQGLVDGWPASFALFALVGFLFAGTWPLVVGMAAARNPVYSGTVLGLTVATGALGVAAAPPLMNGLLAHLPAAWAFPAVATSLVAGAVIVALTAKPRA